MLVTPIATCSFTTTWTPNGTKCKQDVVVGLGCIFLCEEHAREMSAEISKEIGQ
jgi:hypothetical protein